MAERMAKAPYIDNAGMPGSAPAVMKTTEKNQMMGRFTLIVPTYNRPMELARLVAYLDRQHPEFLVLVLDSSEPATLEVNRAVVERAGFNIRIHAFDSNISPWEKFWRGSEMIDTAYCSLCADDDVVILSSLSRIVEYLDTNKDFCAAHGWYFAFYRNFCIRITSSVYRGRSIDDDDAVGRLYSLFKNYEAVTYGVYRTEVMRSVLENVQGVNSMLGRELLGGALSAVHGKVARIPVFYYGRQHLLSHPYVHWHPLDFLVSSPDALYGDYAAYRTILLKSLGASGYDKYTEAELLTLIDLIHFRYLSAYVKPRLMDHLVDGAMVHKPKQEIMQGLWPMLLLETDSSPPAPLGGRELLRQLLRRIRDRFLPNIHLHNIRRTMAPAGDRRIRATTASGRPREYILYRSFLNSISDHPNALEEIETIIQAMNSYE